MTGSLLATIFIGLLGSSPEGKLAGAAVGAAIPTFATVFLSRKTLHLGFAMAITVVALVLVYGGAFAFDRAADKETFPRPGPTPEPTATVGPTATATETPNTDGAKIKVTPNELSCVPECTQQVEITNTGDELLRIGTNRIVNDAEGRFSKAEDCAGFEAAPGAGCRFQLVFSPPQDPDPRTASLEIKSNAGTRTIKLEGRSPPTLVDLAPGQDTKCALDGQQLIVFAPVVAMAGQFDDSVKVKVTAPGFDPELEKTVDEQVGGNSPDIRLDLPEQVVAVDIRVDVDSGGAVTESSEENNRATRTCTA